MKYAPLIILAGAALACSSLVEKLRTQRPAEPVANRTVVEAPPTPDLEVPPRPVADDKNVRTISGGVLNGKAISLPKPDYPPAARAVHASGNVNVQVTINTVGAVESATAVSGHPLLQAAAAKAAREARFSPTLLGGKPVKVSGVITYNFVP